MENTDGVAAAAFIAQDPSTATSSRILETGPACSNPSQEGLPSVLVLEILKYLDLHSLLKCRLICSGFQYLIDSTASLQYKIELAVAGQQDGSYGDTFTRREMLKMHQKRWDGLEWTEVLRVPTMPDYRGIYGGVFVQVSSETDTLHLKRIPSQSRGIKEKNWILDLSTLLEENTITVGKFGMDPSQDLLVIITSPGNSIRIHSLTLSKGECHPLTSGPYLVPHDSSYDLGPDGPFSINICHDFVSIHSFFGAMLWNWKTGQVLMHVVSYKVSSMVFLNERYVLMAIKGDYPYLVAIDFLAEPPERRGLDELENYFIFRFPDISHSSSVDGITVQPNPRSIWGADSNPSVPFSLVPQNRLFVVHLHSNNIDENLYFAILEASFLSLIKTGLRVNNNSFGWSMWGPEHSRALPNYPNFPAWLVPSYGTRFAMKRHLPHGRIFVDVYDFNQLRCLTNKKQNGDLETPENVNVSENSEMIEGRQVCVLAPTRFKANIFRDEVDTRLGYRVTSWSVPGNANERFISAICSEDAIIIQDVTNEMYEIYTV
ncbi:hypothetical protein M378DRAFT_159984 [Amanita muscaria Koide BX008]|uniref:F-box domain-containing protein n=1 Tax=Amanita muscaria (strain Koide BX008) TaxID=946122 RepID=A0A0C2WYZ8_AMAMK|nr:hypothetical protein M378DRAFT_159984 [Amanita muscaria Koide BX008]